MPSDSAAPVSVTVTLMVVVAPSAMLDGEAVAASVNDGVEPPLELEPLLLLPLLELPPLDPLLLLELEPLGLPLLDPLLLDALPPPLELLLEPELLWLPLLEPEPLLLPLLEPEPLLPPLLDPLLLILGCYAIRRASLDCTS